MSVDPHKLLKILAIGHDTSFRGAGVSLRDALEQADFAELRSGFGPNDLLPLIREHRDLIDQWVMYSEDKRTSGGWYLIESSCEVGRIGVEKSLSFPSLEEAVAEYVVRELDAWSGK